MRHGWVYIYECPPAEARFDELIAHLELRGLSLAYPPTGRVIRLSPVGEQIMTTKEELRERFSDSSQVAFNFYLDPSTNVVCSCERLDEEAWREGYSLDGKDEEKSHFVVNMLADLFRQRAELGNAFSFVADNYAELYRDFHWDDFVVGPLKAPPEWPMILGFSKGFTKLRAIPQRQYEVEETDKYLLFKKILRRIPRPMPVR
jgi:hypothetical protein